jgi:NTE family protein
MVLSGGVGLGAYQAGAYEVLHEEVGFQPRWFAASSIGAINAALVAGGPPDRAIGRLRQFWTEGGPPRIAPREPWTGGLLNHFWNWTSAIEARLFGVPGHFQPRFVLSPFEQFSSIYDLAPMRSRIEKLVDFERVNAGDIRVSVATTDLETGDTVLFDTGRGDHIGIEHLMASCGYLPEFAPVEIDGRLLGDGGLSANAPIEPVLEEVAEGARLVFVVDLFARDGARPKTLEDALERKNDLLFGNQTFLRLRTFQRQHELHRRSTRELRMGRSNVTADEEHVESATIFYLSYRAALEEAGSEKSFDYSRHSLERRWQSGRLDMKEALRQLDEGVAPRGGIAVIRRASGNDAPAPGTGESGTG